LCGCLERDYYDEYFLFLPAFAKDIHGSYRWTQKIKDKVVIFTEYNLVFAQMLLDRLPEEVAKNKKGTLFLWMIWVVSWVRSLVQSSAAATHTFFD